MHLNLLPIEQLCNITQLAERLEFEGEMGQSGKAVAKPIEQSRSGNTSK